MTAPTSLEERVARATREEFKRYVVQGTSEAGCGYGPPWKAPWYLIDASAAEPEVNWPGALVLESDDPRECNDRRWELTARAAIRAVRDELMEPDEDILGVGFKAYRAAEKRRDAGDDNADPTIDRWQAMLRHKLGAGE